MRLVFVLILLLLFSPATLLMAQSTCTYTINPSAVSSSSGTFTVTPSNSSCSYNIYSNGYIDIFPTTYGTGTQTFQYSGLIGSENFAAVGTFGPVCDFFCNFSGQLAFITFTDPSITPSSLQATTFMIPNMTVGTTYPSIQLQAMGGAPPYTWNCLSCDNGSAASGPLLVDSTGRVTIATSYDYGQYANYPTLFYAVIGITDSAGNYYPYSLPYESLPASVPPTSFTPPPVMLLDPVPDLLDGSAVTTDPSLLDLKGRSVGAISADGIAQIVLRIAAQAPSDQISATLINDKSLQSTSSDEDGGFTTLGEPVSSTDQLASTGASTADGKSNAYLLYRAPINFVRSSSQSSDASAITRSVSVMITYASAGGQIYATQTSTIMIVRPPVILVHGYAADETSWNDFAPLTADPIHAPLFKVHYGGPVPVIGTIPQLPLPEIPFASTLGIKSVRESDLGFTYSTPDVAQQIIAFIGQFKVGINTNQLQVAGIKADVVAHSMGGLVARYWTTGNAGTYLTPLSYGSGYIHSLTTIATPHYGSPLARLYLHPNSVCTRALGYEAGRFSVGLAVSPGGVLYPGAVDELQGDGNGGGHEHCASAYRFIEP